MKCTCGILFRRCIDVFVYTDNFDFYHREVLPLVDSLDMFTACKQGHKK